MKSTMESIIDDLVVTAFGDRSLREQFLFRESLHNLVRLAKAEHMYEIRSNASKLTGTEALFASTHKAGIDGL